MKALVFAAGLGTRLRPITDTIPKALVPVCGQPLLYHVLNKLKRAGYEEAEFNVHHFPQLIKDYLAGSELGMDIAVSDESACLLETGGGVLNAKDLILPCAGPFLVHNVDIISNLDLCWLREQSRPDALATLVVSERPTRRNLLFDSEMRLVGWTDKATGEVRSPYPDLKSENCRSYAFAGIHNLSPRIFDAFGRYGFSGRFPIMDFYLKACREEPIYGALAEDLKLVDVGKFDTLAEAERQAAEILSSGE